MANIITGCRILCSIALLLCPALSSVYCIIKIPTIAEGNPQSCMRIFPIIADVFGISLRPQ